MKVERKEKLILEQAQVPLRRESDYYEEKDLCLYVPRETKIDMVVGDSTSNVALITGWESPVTAVKADALDSYSVIAPLRTGYGVNLLIYNLMANPQIDTLHLVGWSQNDRTEQAEIPIKILRAALEEGIRDDGVVEGTDFRLHSSLVGAVEQVRQRLNEVILLDRRGVNYDEVLTEAVDLRKEMGVRQAERVILPELGVEKVETLPSERVGLRVEHHSQEGEVLVETWLGYLNNLFRYGSQVSLEHEGAQVRELAYFSALMEVTSITDLEIPKWLAEHPEFELSKEALEDYYQQLYRPDSYYQEIFPGVTKFVNPNPGKYLYAELMFAYPRDKGRKLLVGEIGEKYGLEAMVSALKSLADDREERDDFFKLREDVLEITDKVLQANLSGDKKIEILLEVFDPPLNQYQVLVDRLKTSPDDADKMMFLWDPEVHGVRDHKRPCFVYFSALARNGKLDARAVYRSNDMGFAWLRNAYATMRLVQDMATEAGIKPGKLIMDSESAHIYNAGLQTIKTIYQRGVVEAKPDKKFNEAESDPRGNWLINLVDGQIVMRLVSPGGGNQVLEEIRGRNFKDIAVQLKHLDRVVQPSHMLDLGFQILSADMALRFQKEINKYLEGVDVDYVQDIPFRPILAIREALENLAE